MVKTKKDNIKENENEFDSVWIALLLLLLFGEQPKPPKIINIYMGDE